MIISIKKYLKPIIMNEDVYYILPIEEITHIINVGYNNEDILKVYSGAKICDNLYLTSEIVNNKDNYIFLNEEELLKLSNFSMENPGNSTGQFFIDLLKTIDKRANMNFYKTDILTYFSEYFFERYIIEQDESEIGERVSNPYIKQYIDNNPFLKNIFNGNYDIYSKSGSNKYGIKVLEWSVKGYSENLKKEITFNMETIIDLIYKYTSLDLTSFDIGYSLRSCKAANSNSSYEIPSNNDKEICLQLQETTEYKKPIFEEHENNSDYEEEKEKSEFSGFVESPELNSIDDFETEIDEAEYLF